MWGGGGGMFVPRHLLSLSVCVLWDEDPEGVDQYQKGFAGRCAKEVAGGC